MRRRTFRAVTITTLVLLGTSGGLLANKLSHRIETTAKKSYVFQTYLKGDDINVQAANDGGVTLTGTVAEWSHRSLAEETVAGLRGVKSVDNKLVVTEGSPAENSDAWIRVKVKTLLLFHRNVSGLHTDVDVKAGVVTLRGQASSEAQKELTTEYVKDVDGVQSVTNDLTVETTGKTTMEKVTEHIDDASIKAQVKLALLFHRSTSALKTEVEVKNGVVTVRGLAKNGAEKDLVGKLVENVKGVKVLQNKMVVG